MTNRLQSLTTVALSAGIGALTNVALNGKTQEGRDAATAALPLASALSGSITATFGLQRIARLAGRELTFSEAFGLLSSATSIVYALDPNKFQRLRRLVDDARSRQIQRSASAKVNLEDAAAALRIQHRHGRPRR